MKPWPPEWSRWEMPRSTLSQHEAVCEQRYTEINRRLTNLETKVDAIQHSIDEFKNYFIKLAIRLGIGFVCAMASAVFVIKL